MLTKKRYELFKELIECVAPSGKEYRMARLLKAKYEGLCDEIIYDELGSIVAHKRSKNPNAPKVLVLAHMDEVALHVADIADDGCLKLSNAKVSIWEQTLMTSKCYVLTRSDKLIKGVIDTVPPHMLTPELRAKPMELSNMFVDLGFKNKQEAIDAGINVFDPIIVEGNLEKLSDTRLVGKAYDNRYGCILGIEVLEAFKNKDLDIDLYVGCSVQEEVGCNGAQTITTKISPDFAIILDCSPASDMGSKKEVNGMLGKGVLLRYVDRTMIAFPQLIQYQEEVCKKLKVPCQYYQSPGGTDAGNVHKVNDGVLTLTHCVCARNIHTNSSIFDLDDYEGAKKTLLYMLKDLNKDKIEEFRNYNR